MSKRTAFNPAWLKEELFSSWIARVETDKHKAGCTVCGINLELSNMGKQALISHSKGKKHVDKVKLLAKVKQEQQPLKSFFVSKSISDAAHVESAGGITHESLTVPDPPATDPPTASTSTGGATMTKYVAKDGVLVAGVLWAVKMVMSHYSANSCSNTGDLFKQMFPDSRIAQNFNCGKTKCSYLMCFGLAPYFHDKLMSNLRQSGVVYAISFDESLNRVLQSAQMDVIIHFWDNQENKVCNRYFDSRFLGHATAQDLLENLKSTLDKLNPAGLIQISMDAPNTNWKLLDALIKDRTISDPEIPQLINVGSCE